ncbi:MAG TPA: phosphate acyltransferase PlsX [Candidatus Ozemobacteraceae bacterium]|nr:phosphate acyltransferase PlsX [Candidatus Ozemobacteraceae bacterium]
MKVAIDVMGGDFAPRELVLGAKQYLTSGKAELMLVGRKADILAVWPEAGESCEIVDTPETVEMGEAPTTALRKKKNTSVAVAARLVKEGRASCFLSAGSTGAQMAASLLEIGRVSGVERPAIAVMLPTGGGNGVLVLDVGANVDCRPNHLVQFAHMGVSYYEAICRVEKPRIGVLNIGGEAGKGNELTKAVYELLDRQKGALNFIGNVEPDTLFEGHAHVVVCDGFVGNILLKASEGLSDFIVGTIKQGVAKAGIPAEMANAVLGNLRRVRTDAAEYSGAPLLGIAGCSIVCHGKFKAPSIANAIHLAAQYGASDVVKHIASRLRSDAGSATAL